jgi:hypothetical protein
MVRVGYDGAASGPKPHALTRAVFGWAAALALTLGAWACGSEEPSGTAATGTTSGSGGSGGSDASFKASDCGVCVHEACVAAFDACNADPECPAFVACLDACPLVASGDADPACVDACPTGSGTESKQAVAAINACREHGPGAACAACGVDPDPPHTCPVLNQTCPDPSMETNPCFKCEDEKCCETYAASKANAESGALRQCLVDCYAANGDACEKTCVAQHPDGADDFGAVYGCMLVNCAADTTMCDPIERDACQTCLYDTCGDAQACFFAAPGGYALYGCIVACPIDDKACDQLCYDAYPEAFERFADLASCIDVACKGKC